MDTSSPYFFCGIGGSGMLPLALILAARGATVSGSDRALDQGRTAQKFDYLRARGITLFAQDGSGVTDAKQIVVTSAAVEATIPDVQAATRVGAKLMTRAELLAQLFNAAPESIGIAGTSGKSTVTGMVGWLLAQVGRDPTVMNGAVMKNLVSASEPFASARVGQSGVFVSEVDESDGSIALYTPHVAVVNNISLDHKSMEELRALFAAFVGKANVAVLNLDNDETALLANHFHPPLEGGSKLRSNFGEGSGREPSAQDPSPNDLRDAPIVRPSLKGRVELITYSFTNPHADLRAENLTPRPDGISFDLSFHLPLAGRSTRDSASGGGKPIRINLLVPGRHNVANALAAIAAAMAIGVSPADAAKALETFTGVKRRLETVGTRGGITVIDDFAHNPDKITATLATLHDFPGRLLIMFQPHGFGPLKKMGNEFIETFATQLAKHDVLVMPDPVYFGGTTDKSVSSIDIVNGVKARGREAYQFATREECGTNLIELAKQGDRIVIMGARDDTLSTFAADVLSKLG